MQLDAPAHKAPTISLTPLIDVVFILLIFFMLATRFSMLQNIDLGIEKEGANSHDPSIIWLDLLSAKKVMRDGSEHDWLTLIETLPKENKSVAIMIGAEKTVNLQTLIEFKQLLTRGGYVNSSLALIAASDD